MESSMNKTLSKHYDITSVYDKEKTFEKNLFMNTVVSLDFNQTAV